MFSCTDAFCVMNYDYAYVCILNIHIYTYILRNAKYIHIDIYIQIHLIIDKSN
jgi:hypothetical protein